MARIRRHTQRLLFMRLFTDKESGDIRLLATGN